MVSSQQIEAHNTLIHRRIEDGCSELEKKNLFEVKRSMYAEAKRNPSDVPVENRHGRVVGWL